MEGTPLTADEERNVHKILFDCGTLMHLYIGRWTGNKKMHESDLLIEGEVDKSVFYIGHKKLLPPEAVEKLQNIEGRARRYLAGRSVPFVFANARFVAYSALRGVLTQLEAMLVEWKAAKDELFERYPIYKEQQLEKLAQQAHVLAEQELDKVPKEKLKDKRATLHEWENEQKKTNAALYPELSDLSDRFPFEWRMFKISPLEGMEQMSSLSAQDILAERDRIRSDMSQWVSETSVLIHQQLGEAAANARKVLVEHGKLNPKNLRPLFEAFEAFEAMSFAGPSQFQNTIQAVRDRYIRKTGDGKTDWTLTADTVNGSTEEMRRLLSSMSELAAKEVAKEAGIKTVQAGAFGRVVSIE